MTLTNELLESLLWEEESNTLDFKEGQYAFAGATDDQKAEIIKDILAFANAFRRADAYILRGVREIKGGRSIPTGVPHHLEDAHLQQLVNAKTNRVVEFSYRAIEMDGNQVGVIWIPRQDRPTYLHKNYGKLKANDVYIRHGSSTDIATPDEIKRMGRDDLLAKPTIILEFGNRQTRSRLGVSTTATSLVLRLHEDIPDYRPQAIAGFENMFNKDYYREIANTVMFKHLTTRCELAVTNESAVTANDLRLEATIDDPDGHLYLATEAPAQPHSGSALARPPAIHIGTAVTIDHDGTTWHITARFGKVQPGATTFLDSPFYIGATTSTAAKISATLFADNLPAPEETMLRVDITAKTRDVALADLHTMYTASQN